MATHSSTLAWKIPWTEEPVGLQSMGSQRVSLDWITSLHFTLIWIAFWPYGLIAPCFLGNLWSLVSWSLSEEATLHYCIYTLTEFNKAPCSTRDLGPRVLLSLCLSLFLADSLEREGWLCNPGTISLFPSFIFLLSTLDCQVLVH